MSVLWAKGSEYYSSVMYIMGINYIDLEHYLI
jgi:hypothetical protein